MAGELESLDSPHCTKWQRLPAVRTTPNRECCLGHSVEISYEVPSKYPTRYRARRTFPDFTLPLFAVGATQCKSPNRGLARANRFAALRTPQGMSQRSLPAQEPRPA